MLRVCLLPHLPHFSLGPCDWISVFCPSQKQEKLPATAAHLPAGDVLPQTFPHGSIHHSWPILALLASGRGREPAHPQGRAPATPPPPPPPPPHTHTHWLPPWSSARLLASQLWALSCVLPRPQREGRGRTGGGSWGRGKREDGEEPPSLIS
uniref:Uncharacterized protein n=1 Tax=Pipistrellus kuhlii TaxID=59472 RepID=A0A7J8B1K5_PIPKU|nr:hypothetical protein mPipKuh1_007736 [Pipistrellus kuhlii]